MLSSTITSRGDKSGARGGGPISLRDSCGLKYLDYTNSMLTTHVSLSVCPSVLPPARWAYLRLKLTRFRSDGLPRPVGYVV